MKYCFDIKRIRKIITLVLFVIIVILSAEVFCVTKEISTIIEICISEKKSAKEILTDIKWYIPFMYKTKREFNDLKHDFRAPIIKETNKGQIILSGCSYAFGSTLAEKDSLHTILSDVTNRTVSNISIIGGSPREALYILSNQEMINRHIEKGKDVEYFIYISLKDHTVHLYKDSNPNVPQYKADKNYSKITFVHNDRLYKHTFLYNEIKKLKYSLTTEEEQKKLRNLFFIQMNAKLKEVFPNSKFVILNYDTQSDEELLSLEREGIKVMTLKDYKDDITSSEYMTKHINPHPNKQAYEETAKILKRELKL